MADRTPVDPDVLYTQARRVRTLELRWEEAQQRLDQLGREMGELDGLLGVARMSLRQMLADVEPLKAQGAPWGVAE